MTIYFQSNGESCKNVLCSEMTHSFNSEKKCTKAIYSACHTPGKPKTRKVYHSLFTFFCFRYDSKLFSTAICLNTTIKIEI